MLFNLKAIQVKTISLSKFTHKLTILLKNCKKHKNTLNNVQTLTTLYKNVTIRLFLFKKLMKIQKTNLLTQ